MKITSINKREKSILNKINFNSKHKDSLTLKNELVNIENYLKRIGYFTASIDSVIQKDKTSTFYFSLNKKTNHATLQVAKTDTIYFKNYSFKNNKVNIKINELEQLLKNTSKLLDQEGRSLAKVKLKDILFHKDTLFAKVQILQSKKRTINKVVLKGYENFPRSFLKNYFQINKKTILEKNKLTKVSEDAKNLTFVQELKAPELLFTKDSTFLYLYLEKKSNNSIDALVNFATLENGKVLFNGTIDLMLENILNTGESFHLFWNSIAEERQEFKIATKIPFIFNSKISPEVSFSIYRQDSTFTNTSFKTSLVYNLNTKINLGLLYSSENSESLSIDQNDVPSFTNNFFGFDLTYRIYNNDTFNNDKILLNLNSGIGRRSSLLNNSNQFKLNLTASYLWKLNPRNSIFIKNNTSFLNSDQYFTNELFRIGGANTVRGFNEQSIFTKNHSFFNLEYRLLTSVNSYLYTITDFALLDDNTNQLLGLGVGYKFINKSSLINLGIVNGTSLKNQFKLENVKLILSWVNYF